MPALPNIIVYLPQSDRGKEDLARRVATVHADSVDNKMKQLSIPHPQKLQLLQSLIDNAK